MLAESLLAAKGRSQSSHSYTGAWAALLIINSLKILDHNNAQNRLGERIRPRYTVKLESRICPFTT